MTVELTLFRLEGSAEEAIAQLAGELRLDEESGRRERETWYDTFDWELANRGWRLRRRQISGHDELVLGEAHSAIAAATQQLEASEIARGELPPGPVQEEALPMAGLRRILPQVSVDRRVRRWRVLDGEDKTVVRIELWEGSVKDLGAGGARPAAAGAGRSSLPGVLVIRPLRGYESDFRRVAAACRARLAGLVGDGLVGDGLDLALEACGRDRVREHKLPPVILEPGARSDVSLARLLHGLAETVASNVPGTIADLDTEFLHDLRVAVRRTRSALSQVKRVLPDEPLEAFRDELRWLGNVTGPVRDLDVFLLGFDGLAAQVSPDAQEHLEPLRAHLEESREREQRRLVRHLRSRRARALLEEWPAFLRGVIEQRPQGAIRATASGAASGAASRAASPVAKVARGRISKTDARMRRQGRAIGEDTPPQELHELRIQGKKLRYLLELFRSLQEPAEYARQHAALKRLQSVLGDYNDCAVQEEALARFATELREREDVPTETLLAMGRLAERIALRAVQLRTRFAQLFAEYDAPEQRRGLKRLLETLAEGPADGPADDAAEDPAKDPAEDGANA